MDTEKIEYLFPENWRKNNPCATSCATRGSEWSRIALVDGWGDTPDADIDRLADMVVARFHEIARENGSSATWIPGTSEVIAHIDERAGHDYEEWREQATNGIWSAWCNGDLPEFWD